MSHQINVHLPPGVTNLDSLSLTDFISQTKTDGAVKTTDLYYHPSTTGTKVKEKFLQKLGAFSARISGHWKPAMSSGNLEKAMARINGTQYLNSKYEVANRFPSALTQAAAKNGEYSNNGATITLMNADDTMLLDYMTKDL